MDRLVAPFDLDAYAAQLRRLCQDVELRSRSPKQLRHIASTIAQSRFVRDGKRYLANSNTAR